ncbi:hypothetical protein FRB99_000454, partial [Tulasnella sp. 403]
RTVTEWLAWSVFDKPLSVLDHVQKMVVEEATVLVEKRTGGRLKDEADVPKYIAPITLTWDPVNIWSRPGIVYVLGDLLNRSAKWLLKWRFDMVSGEFDGMEYLVRLPPEEDASKGGQTPLVFMHGLGFGIAQYVLTIYMLVGHLPRSQPVLIPIQPNISQAILHPAHMVQLKREQWVQCLKGVIEKFGWDEDGVTMLSHSKGSLIHAWMVKAHPELVRRNCFVDPDPYYTSFFLGGKDAVIDGWRVRRYFANHGVGEGLKWNPNGHHGQPFIDPRSIKHLRQWLVEPEPAPQSPSDSLDSESSIESDSDDMMEIAQHIFPDSAESTDVETRI